MRRKSYVPAPVDTTGVALPEELGELVEIMSKNVHEVWAETRIKQGWSWGPTRDDANKQHPCLIAYEELSDDEKVFDRNSAVETLKLILKNGFKIKKEG